MPFFLSYFLFSFLFVTGLKLLRAGNVNDKDRCINVYFARKNLEPKFNSKNYKMLHEMDCAFKVIFLNSYRRFCRNQSKKV